MPEKARETDLEMATRHLAEAAPRIALLERIIEDLQSAGRDASTASSMLRTFVGLRDAMEDHLASLQRYPRGQAGGASSTSYAPKAACPHHLILGHGDDVDGRRQRNDAAGG